MRKYLALFLVSFVSLFSSSKTIYEFSNEPIDVIIPCIDKDLDTLELCIKSTRKYVENVRRIIVISKSKITKSAEWFDEKKYPFSKSEIALEIFGGDDAQAKKFTDRSKSRVGWIYQQFLKLYAYLVIPNISSNILVVDADVIWMQPISFTSERGEPFFTAAYEHHAPYYAHMARLLKGLSPSTQYSGVAHHMLFQAPILKDLFAKIREEHGMEPWKAICLCIDRKYLNVSSFSEYEIYFNFALARSDQCQVREIKWNNFALLQNLEEDRKKGYAYVACHSWRGK
jgi:hypothetical protein